MVATATATATITGSPARLPIHQLDLAAYNEIVASGALEGEHVELLEGVLVEMSPQSARHAAAIELLTRHFAGADAWLRVQLPLEVPPDSEPEPDLALIAERPPQGQHPRTALLVVEVSVSSQATDRDVKAKLYARAGIATCWLIDLPARAIEVLTNPHADGYRNALRYTDDTNLPCPLNGVPDLDLAAFFEGVGD